jgi:hypothetical protein
LNLFKAGRDLGLASKLSKCTLLMRSAGNSPASLINILHGGEDVGKSTDEKTGKFQENSMSAGSNSQPANTQKNSPNGANTTTPTHRNNMVSVEPMHMTPDAVDRSNDIIFMTTHQLCNYLEQANCSGETISKVVETSLTGENWSSLLSEPDADDLLGKNLMVAELLTRRKLIGEVKIQSTARLSQQSKLTEQSLSGNGNQPTDERSPYIACAKLRVPPLPTPEEGRAMVSHTQWKAFTTALMAWGAVGDSTYAKYLGSIVANSSQSLADLMDNLTQKQITIDGILAQSLIASAEPKFMAKYIVDSSTHMLGGHFSGLKIIQTFSRVINKRTEDGATDALNMAMKRKPVTNPVNLYGALQQCQEDIETLLQQGGSADNQFRMAILKKMISELMLKPEMTVKLTLPVAKVLDDFPGNPDKLYEVLEDKAEDMLREAGYTTQTAPKTSMAAQIKSNDNKSNSKRTPKRPPTEALCPFYREGLKECNNPKCNRKHEGRTGKVCSSEDYSRYGFCKDISMCKDMHPWNPERGDRKEKLAEYQKLQKTKQGDSSKKIVAAVHPAQGTVRFSPPSGRSSPSWVDAGPPVFSPCIPATPMLASPSIAMDVETPPELMDQARVRTAPAMTEIDRDRLHALINDVKVPQ